MRLLKCALLAAAASAAGCAVYPSQPYYGPPAGVVQPAYGYGYAGPSVYVAPAPVVVAPRPFFGGGWRYGYGGGPRRGGWGRGRWH